MSRPSIIFNFFTDMWDRQAIAMLNGKFGSEDFLQHITAKIAPILNTGYGFFSGDNKLISDSKISHFNTWVNLFKNKQDNQINDIYSIGYYGTSRPSIRGYEIINNSLNGTGKFSKTTLDCSVQFTMYGEDRLPKNKVYTSMTDVYEQYISPMFFRNNELFQSSARFNQNINDSIIDISVNPLTVGILFQPAFYSFILCLELFKHLNNILVMTSSGYCICLSIDNIVSLADALNYHLNEVSPFLHYTNINWSVIQRGIEKLNIQTLANTQNIQNLNNLILREEIVYICEWVQYMRDCGVSETQFRQAVLSNLLDSIHEIRMIREGVVNAIAR